VYEIILEGKIQFSYADKIVVKLNTIVDDLTSYALKLESNDGVLKMLIKEWIKINYAVDRGGV